MGNMLHFTLVFVVAATALRSSEVLSLRWADILWDERKIRIVKAWKKTGVDGDTKTPSSERDVPMDQIAMHFACCNTSSGIPLSGIPIISCITLVALSSRSVASSRADPAQHSVPRQNIARTKITFFMEHPLFCLRRFSDFVLCLGHKSSREFGHTKVNPTLQIRIKTVCAKMLTPGIRKFAQILTRRNLPSLVSDEAEARSRGGQFCSDLGKPRD